MIQESIIIYVKTYKSSRDTMPEATWQELYSWQRDRQRACASVNAHLFGAE